MTVLAAAIAEAERRNQASDADLSGEVNHDRAMLPVICARWRLTVHDWLPGGVNPPPLAVTTRDGVAAVLTIRTPAALEVPARVIEAAKGRGYVRAFARDSEAGALLTERLGHDLWSEHPDLASQVRIVVPLLQQAWAVPLEVGGPVEHKARGLADVLSELGERYGGAAPSARRLARRYADELAVGEAADVVCHGDPHAGNVLRRGEGWALIDCDGFVSEKAYDLGVLLRDACGELEAHRLRPGSGSELLQNACRTMAEQTGVDAERIWRWGFIERVTTGLYLAWLGFADEAARMLSSAEVLAEGALGTPATTMQRGPI